MALFYLYAFFLGGCIGSFVNVVALRTANDTSFLRGRSHCPKCGATLRGVDLIPVLSYLFLRGRCHACHARISLRYPVTELVSGGLFMLCLWQYGLSLEALNACLLASLLLCVFLTDLDTLTIPNGLVLCFLAPAALDVWLTGGADIWGRVIGIFVISLPMFLLTLLIPDCFGGGDIKLMAVCGFLLGWRAALMAAFFAIVSCGLFALILLLTKRAKRGDHIAFGPWLAVGIFAAKLFYLPIMTAYLSLFV